MSGEGRFRLGIAAAAMLACVAVVACGSSDGGDDEETRIRIVIRDALTTSNPANCRRLVTQRFLEQAEFKKGREAVRDCEEDAKTDRPARDVAISRIGVSDDRAKARAALRGGDSDGATADLALVKQDGDWKLDRVTAVELDFERYLRAGRRALMRPPAELTARQAECITEKIRARGESAAERSIVAGDPDAALAAFVSCMRGPDGFRATFERQIRRDLAGRLPRTLITCVIRELRRTISDRQLEEAFKSQVRGEEYPSEITEASRRAGATCARTSGRS